MWFGLTWFPLGSHFGTACILCCETVVQFLISVWPLEEVAPFTSFSSWLPSHWDCIFYIIQLCRTLDKLFKQSLSATTKLWDPWFVLKGSLAIMSLYSSAQIRGRDNTEKSDEAIKRHWWGSVGSWAQKPPALESHLVGSHPAEYRLEQKVEWVCAHFLAGGFRFYTNFAVL